MVATLAMVEVPERNATVGSTLAPLRVAPRRGRNERCYVLLAWLARPAATGDPAGRTWCAARSARDPVAGWAAVGGEGAVQQHSQPVSEVSRAPLAGDREAGDQVGGEQRPEQFGRAAGGPWVGEGAIVGERLGEATGGGGGGGV